jgi:aspartyl-tRNA(Asn)/glutamyl-tRNA(Gln) amidotransferase subunit C
MEVTNELIDRLAHLSRLEFDKASHDAMKSDFEKMLHFVEKLDEINTDGVAPLVYMNTETNVLRKDEVKMEVSQAEALKNAPSKDTDYIKVATVLNI